MAILRRALYAAATVWALSGLAVAVAPRFWLVTVFDQASPPDFASARFAGIEAVALAMLMVVVAHHAEQAWWWSWAFVVATAGVAVTAIVNVLTLPDAASTGLWWLIFGVNILLAPAIGWGLAKTGTERTPV